MYKNKTNWRHENILNISRSVKKEPSTSFLSIMNHNYTAMTEIVLREKSIERESLSTKTTDYNARSVEITDKFTIICQEG